MLSMVDLLQTRTLTEDLAAYLAAALQLGASFLVGASPGGAGKTTVMGALLNFVPEGVELLPADGMAAIQRGFLEKRRACHLCHEIGPGDYYAYLWGGELRAYFQLKRHGHILATNLHADTLEEARAQICGENGVPEADFVGMNLVLFLHTAGWAGPRRVIQAWESRGDQPHRLLYHQGRLHLEASQLVDPSRFKRGQTMIRQLVQSRARTIEEVRKAVVAPSPSVLEERPGGSGGK